MLKVLELTYYGGAADEDLRLSESAEEIDGLLNQEVCSLVALKIPRLTT